MAGPMPIQWQEIDAWARLTQNEPDPWEIDVLTALDVAYLGQRLKTKRQDTGGD